MLCMLGAVLPLSQFMGFLVEHGFDLALMWSQIIISPISRFLAYDLFISGAAVVVFMYVEGRKVGMGWWQRILPLVGTFLVGVSFGFPLFLYLREIRLEKGMD